MKRKRVYSDSGPPRRRPTGIRSPPFAHLCAMLDSIEDTKDSRKGCQNDFNKFFAKHYKGPNQPDHYHLMRLLCAESVGRESNIAVKEERLRRVLAVVPGMPLRDDERRQLRHWRQPSMAPGTSRASSSYLNFSDVLVDILRRRGGYRDTHATLEYVNAFLDKLELLRSQVPPAAAKKRSKKGAQGVTDGLIGRQFVEILEGSKLSLREIKWLIRIVLRHLNCGRSTKTFLQFYHPGAWEFYQSQHDLKRLCRLVQTGVGFPKTTIVRPGTPFRPMLAAEDKSWRKKGLGDWSRLQRALMEHEWVAEPKFDGERILIHFWHPNGDDQPPVIAYYTRRPTDYTKEHAALFDDVVISALGPFFRSAIVDGEMLVYDTDVKKHLPFGANPQYSKSPTLSQHFSYQCFDIIHGVPLSRHLNSLPSNVTLPSSGLLIEMQYVQRKALLRLAVVQNAVPSPRFVVVDETRLALSASVADVRGMMEKAVLDNNFEGILLKRADATYHLGKRHGSWLKVKPRIGRSIDLLVLGGFRGTKFPLSGRRGRRRGRIMGNTGITHFLMGVAATEKQRTNISDAVESVGTAQRALEAFTQSSSGMDGSRFRQLDEDLRYCIIERDRLMDSAEFVPVVKLGTGYNARDCSAIQNSVQFSSIGFDKAVLPRWLVRSKWRPTGRQHTPDYLIENPSKSVILEVNFQEIIASDEYPLGKSLRFPRFKCIRSDKNWFESDSADKIQSDDGRIQLPPSEMMIDDAPSNEFSTEAVAPRTRPQREVAMAFRDTDTIDVEMESPIFQLEIPNSALSSASVLARRRALEGLAFRNVELDDGAVFDIGYDSRGVSTVSPIVFNVQPTPDGSTKAEMERQIVQFGGTKTQSRSTADIILIPDNVELYSHTMICQLIRERNERGIGSEEKDCLTHSWFRKCVAERRFVPWTKADFGDRSVGRFDDRSSAIQHSRTRRLFHLQMDPFGDYFFDKTSVETLRSVFRNMQSQMSPQSDDSVSETRRKLIAEINDDDEDDDLFTAPNGNSTNVLADCQLYYYFIGSSTTSLDSLYKSLALSMGAEESADMKEVTHILVPTDFNEETAVVNIWRRKRNRARMGDRGGPVQNRVHVVRTTWIDACLREMEKVDEDVHLVVSL